MRNRNSMFTWTTGTLLTLSVSLLGCSSSGDPEPKDVAEPAKDTTSANLEVAICDMDKVAEELGFLQDLNRILSNRKTQLNNKVRILQSQKQMEINKKIEEFGDEPSEEQKKELAKMQIEANQILRQAQGQANQMMTSARTSLIQQIRTKIKAPVDKIATEKGIDIVVTKHPDMVIFSTDDADITSEVISAAREASLTRLAPEPAEDDSPSTDDASGGGNASDGGAAASGRGSDDNNATGTTDSAADGR